MLYRFNEFIRLPFRRLTNFCTIYYDGSTTIIEEDIIVNASWSRTVNSDQDDSGVVFITYCNHSCIHLDPIIRNKYEYVKTFQARNLYIADRKFLEENNINDIKLMLESL